MKKRLIKISIIVVLVGLLSTLVAVLIIKAKATYTPREPYDKTSFVDYDKIPANKIYTLENSKFEFQLDSTTTKFQILDKTTNQTWHSNVDSYSSNPLEFNDLYTVYYERKIGTPRAVSVYEESIKHHAYSFRITEQSIDVLYKVGGKRDITFNDLPQKVPAEKFEKLILEPLEELAKSDFDVALDLSFLKSVYFKPEGAHKTGAYHLRNIINPQSILDIYILIFEKSDYTYDDYVQDSKHYNIPAEKEVAYFEFVVSYSLSEKGFKVQIINDSILESADYLIAYLDILPYFGAGNVNDSGFTVIPDGSGIYIDHENQRYNTAVYNKRIYGSDLSLERNLYVAPEQQEIIKLPMYVYSKNNYGYINALLESDSMASIRTAFKTTSEAGSYVNKVPYIHYRYYLRERDAYKFKSNVSEQDVNIWTYEYNTTDYLSEYIFVTDGSNYSNFAKAYQTYLIDNYNLESRQTADYLHLTFLGGFKEKKYFVGIPYQQINPLTKARDIPKILTELDLAENYSISYQGWSNEGIKPKAMNKISFDSKVMKKDDLTELLAEVEQRNINLYLEFLTNSGFSEKNIKVKKDVVKTLLQNPVGYYKFNPATNLIDRQSLKQYYFTPEMSTKVYQEMVKFLAANKLNNVGISDDSSRLASDYARGKVVFKNELIESFDNNLKLLEEKNVLMRNSNLYAILQANKVLDFPLSGTRHGMVDYSIPFIQLIFSGQIDYFGSAVNLDTSKSLKWHELKAIETGSKIQYVLSAEDTVKLINTEYSNYFSTYYQNWLTAIKTIYENLAELDIYGSELISHQPLNADATIVKVTYSNGKSFIINYLTETLESL